MRAQIVPRTGHLVGRKCMAGCRNQIAAGQSVLVRKLDPFILAHAADPWFVMHVDCVRAKCDSAPEGIAPSNQAASIAIWRRELLADGAIPIRS
jgi:hypothetical protein